MQKPDMNSEVILDDKAAWIAKRNKVYLDMYWEAGNLDVEHHGKLDHSEFEDVISDRARVNAVREQGFEVIELTGEQVDDIMCFEYIIARIAKLVGRKLDGRYMGYADNRIKLHDKLKKWNASSGQIR